MKPSPPQFFVQWPYYVLGFSILLFLVAGECPRAGALSLPSVWIQELWTL